jgi:hypothetical protein
MSLPEGLRAKRKRYGKPLQSSWTLGETSFRRQSRPSMMPVARTNSSILSACREPVGSLSGGVSRPGHSAKDRGSRDVIVNAIGLSNRTGSETQISPGRQDVRSQSSAFRPAIPSLDRARSVQASLFGLNPSERHWMAEEGRGTIPRAAHLSTGALGRLGDWDTGTPG